MLSTLPGSLASKLATACGLALLLSNDASARGLDEVLVHARASAGRTAWARLEGDLRLTGSARVKGVDSGFELLFAADGKYRFRTDGPLANTSTWDGVAALSQDAGGPLRELALLERDQTRLSQWVHSSYWLDERAPVELELVDETAEQVSLRVTVTSEGTVAHVSLDKRTWLPTELRFTSSGYDVVLGFGDYRAVEGIPLAHRVTFAAAGVEGFVAVEAAGKLEFGDGTRYTLGASPPGNTRFAPELPPTIEVRRAKTGHLLVHPTIDGRQPGWFVLDTGAGQLCIDPTAADALEQPEFGQVPAVGVGGSVTASFRQGVTLELGPLVIADPVYVELDLAFLETYFGVPVAGICGYDVFARCVLELDLETPSAALYDPASYELKHGRWSNLTVENQLPCLPCKFEGDRAGLFRIDTGDAGTVTFHGPAVERLGLLEGRELQKIQVGGVGGAAEASTGLIEWFELGGRRFDAVQATFASDGAGSHSATQVVGTLGTALFQPFRIVFDYPHQRIALVPRAE